MTVLLLIKKEDINTSILGENFMITTRGGIQINLTADAADELIEDLKALKLSKIEGKKKDTPQNERI